VLLGCSRAHSFGAIHRNTVWARQCNGTLWLLRSIHMHINHHTSASADSGCAIMRRWNTLAADNVGVHLQLMPMLLGFLTYKGAVIARGAHVVASRLCCCFFRAACTGYQLLFGELDAGEVDTVHLRRHGSG
jgi:hypothetical protein